MDVTYSEIARASSERGEVILRERHSDDGAAAVMELRVNGMFVMDSQETSSEVALAQAALARVHRPARVVIGGLGLGYTLEAVLADPRVEQVAVVEIEDALISWMRSGTIPRGPGLLADRRVKIVNADLAMAVAEATGTYDLVLLDVDNGPGFLVHDANRSLYQPPFLAEVRSMLRPRGVLAVWSMDPAPALQEAIGAVFEASEAIPQPVLLQEREEEYWLVTGTRSVDTVD